MRTKPGERPGQARRARNAAEVTNGGTRGGWRVSHMRQEGAGGSSGTTPRSDSRVHTQVRAAERWCGEPEARVKQLEAELPEPDTLLSGDPR